MGRKRMLAIFLILIFMVFTCTAFMYVKRLSKSWYQTTQIPEYAFEISYPNAYKIVQTEETNVDELSTKITSTLTEIEKEVELSMDFVEELIYVKSDKSKMTLLVEGIKKAKSPKTIEEICKDYITMFKVFNSSVTVISEEYEEVIVDGVNAGRVKILVEGKKEGVYPGMISYLIPLEDREITIAITGTDEMFNLNSKEIEKIINSVNFIDNIK